MASNDKILRVLGSWGCWRGASASAWSESSEVCCLATDLSKVSTRGYLSDKEEDRRYQNAYRVFYGDSLLLPSSFQAFPSSLRRHNRFRSCGNAGSWELLSSSEACAFDTSCKRGPPPEFGRFHRHKRIGLDCPLPLCDYRSNKCRIAIVIAIAIRAECVEIWGRVSSSAPRWNYPEKPRPRKPSHIAADNMTGVPRLGRECCGFSFTVSK